MIEFERDPKERCTSLDDQATQQEEEFLADALERQARTAMPRTPAGICANCDETLQPTQHYCDTECRRDHERRLAADKRAGRRA